MADTIGGFLSMLENVPRPVWAIVAGILVSWGVTQRVKFLIDPNLARWRRHALVQRLAFLAAAATTLLVWSVHPNGLRASWDGVVAAVIVGLCAPLLWWVVIRLVGKRFPELRDRLSQDVRDDAPTDEPEA